MSDKQIDIENKAYNKAYADNALQRRKAAAFDEIVALYATLPEGFRDKITDIIEAVRDE